MSVIAEAVMQSPLWRTLPGRLRAHALARPESVALREKSHGIWRPTTWREYWEAVQLVGYGLKALGVEPGDHVAILSDNRPEWLFADLGAQGIGARGVGIYQTNPAADVAYVVSHSESKVLFCEDQEQVDKAIEIAAETPSVTAVVVFEPRGTLDYADPRLMSWEAFLAQGRASMASSDPDWFESRVAALDPASASMVVYTSGTTGQPKGAMLSPRNALVIPDGMIRMSESDESDLILSYLPLCHVAEKIFSLFLPLTTGCIVHFGEAIETVREDLREVSPTIFLGVPRIWEKMHASVTLKMADSSWLKRTLFNRFTALGVGIAERRRAGRLSILDRLVWALGDALVFRPLQERLGMRRCRFPVTGAAPVSAELLTWFHGIGVPIVEGYGQTECAGVSHCNPLEGPQLGSVGQGLPGVEVSLATDGEILVRGPSVFVGYLHNAKATAETIDAEGWLHTGDLGSMDADGFTHITGRKKEIIITAGGKNLSPEKIENALKMSPYVKEAIAIGDRRKFISALVQIDRDAVGDWAQRKGVVYTSFPDLAAKPEVVELIGREISASNDRLGQVEHVRAFRLLLKELNQDDGELTATQKVRRKVVCELHGALIESIYSGGKR
jgi:long-chain acyl-CoA synthetase